MTDRIINTINGRMSLRDPQKESLERLARVCEIIQLKKDSDVSASLAAIHSEYPSVTDFERDFPSLCFALATGVGKTRLMGAFISYLYLTRGIRNYFVLAPNLTIYNKLITDFTPNTPKYVFTGIAAFSTERPLVITGDNYENQQSVRGGKIFDDSVHINIFNISKINTEVRGGNTPRIKRLSEYIGQSYFEYLAALPDLVLIMDESHRYRASAGVKAINELKPILGLELTATPFIETARETYYFKNTIYEFPLSKAMEMGYVKEPAVVTQKNFQPSDFTTAQVELIKLEDGVRVHEDTKVELATYAQQTGFKLVKPFILVIARDTTHAADLLKLIQSDKFFEGRYKDKVIQVDSSTKEDELVERLLRVEDPEEPTEIVIHVNMLKEGWDVTNLYTIIPLRAANARTLVEQSIGRGLRLPYGKRTGVSSVDRLNIIAHDKFQEIIDEANREDSVIRLTQIILDPDDFKDKKETIVIKSNLDTMLSQPVSDATGKKKGENLFKTETERKVAERTKEIIKKYQNLPSSKYLEDADTQKLIAKDVKNSLESYQTALPGLDKAPDIKAIVKTITSEVIKNTIDIPRIVVTPKGEVSTGFSPFTLDCTSIHYQPVNHDLLLQHLRTHEQQTLQFTGKTDEEIRLEDYIVRGLIDYEDISYDDHADLLYNLSEQMVKHLSSYLGEKEVQDVLIYHQKQIVECIYAQMVKNQWEKTVEYKVNIAEGFSSLLESTVTAKAGDTRYNFLEPVKDKIQITKMLFSGFKHCLYPEQKFQSDPERRCAVILDRDSEKWFRPVKNQFKIYYKSGHNQFDYIPDFIAETKKEILMIEVKSTADIDDTDVQSKKNAANTWCARATTHTATCEGKPWKYLLIPHDNVSENMTLDGLIKQYGVK
jgi:type III restriction enzyme